MGPGFESQRDHFKSLKLTFGAFFFCLRQRPSSACRQFPLLTKHQQHVLMESPINIHLPITISYPALEGVLQKQAVGQYIPKPEAGVDSQPYAKILGVEMTGHATGGYNVVLWVKLKILRTVLKRDEVNLQILATVGYDNAAQNLYVRQFKLSSMTSSSFYNTALEVLANKVAYSQIVSKSQVYLNDILAAEMKRVNGMLAEGVALKGASLQGEVKELSILDVVPQPQHVSLSLKLEGNLQVHIKDLLSVMPPA
ncbi:DUF4403 family protein [Pontibacter sp. CAU 1760]